MVRLFFRKKKKDGFLGLRDKHWSDFMSSPWKVEVRRRRDDEAVVGCNCKTVEEALEMATYYKEKEGYREPEYVIIITGVVR